MRWTNGDSSFSFSLPADAIPSSATLAEMRRFPDTALAAAEIYPVGQKKWLVSRHEKKAFHAVAGERLRRRLII